VDRAAIRRRLATVLAVLTASGVLAVAVPVQAQAAATQCSGRKIRTYTFSTGSVKIYKEGGYLCGVTVPKRVGAPRIMLVSIQARGSEAAEDKGEYTKRAGPVRVYVGNRKVWIKGRVGTGSYDTKRWIRL
jgi:hypothetical protein